jgi:hypothetical protein
VKDILARMKYKEASFSLLELKSGEYQWYQDTLIFNIQE